MQMYLKIYELPNKMLKKAVFDNKTDFKKEKTTNFEIKNAPKDCFLGAFSI